MYHLWSGAARVLVQEEKNLTVDGVDAHGCSEELINVDGDDWMVILKEGLHPRSKALTLFHELLHVVDESQALGLGEETIRRLEQWFGGLCRSNPKVMTALVQDLCGE